MSGVLRALDGARPLETRLAFRVQVYDVDYGGHVFNGVYVRWLEDLRMEMHERYLPLRDLSENHAGPILARTEIDYLRPVRIFDHPEGLLWCKELGRASLWLKAEFRVGEAVCCRARQRLGFLRYDTRRPLRCPAPLRDAFLRTNQAPAGR